MENKICSRKHMFVHRTSTSYNNIIDLSTQQYYVYTFTTYKNGPLSVPSRFIIRRPQQCGPKSHYVSVRFSRSIQPGHQSWLGRCFATLLARTEDKGGVKGWKITTKLISRRREIQTHRPPPTSIRVECVDARLVRLLRI